MNVRLMGTVQANKLVLNIIVAIRAFMENHVELMPFAQYKIPCQIV